MNAYYYSTKLGKILLAEDGLGITRLTLIPEQDNNSEAVPEAGQDQINERYDWKETPLLMEAARQFEEYLEGKRSEFTVKLHPKGTKFQLLVWDELKRIPYGETRSYKQIAQAVGNERASRAVGMANHNNPIMCIVPCHRVIGADGKMVGYGGGLPLKKKLLELEARYLSAVKSDL